MDDDNDEFFLKKEREQAEENEFRLQFLVETMIDVLSYNNCVRELQKINKIYAQKVEEYRESRGIKNTYEE